MRRFVVAATLLAVATAAHAVPIGGKLVLRRQGGRAPNLATFTARHRAVRSPPRNSANAPTVAGMTVEIVSADGGRIAIDIPAGGGWRVARGKRANGAYQLRGPRGLRVVLRDGHFRFKVENPSGLSFDRRHGGAGIRVEIGTESLCAWFGGAGVLVDRPGLFIGRRLSSRDCGPFEPSTTTTIRPPGSTTSTTLPPDGCGNKDTFHIIQKQIFSAHGCTVATCHGARESGGLDLRPGAAHRDLVGIAASNAPAAAAGKKRVVPGNPAASFLSQKLHGDLAAGEGARMPLSGGPLTFIELMLVDVWIAGGAPERGAVPGAPCPPKGHKHGPADQRVASPDVVAAARSRAR